MSARSEARNAPADRRTAAERFAAVRRLSPELVEPLETEDMVVQSATFASPARWHLAHTTWFFETFIVRELDPSYRSPDDRYRDLFNSYYNAVGAQYPRPRRGVLSRPTVREVMDWREHVDGAMLDLVSRGDPRLDDLLDIGLHHEQQHQELMLMDLKHAFSCNPLDPVYRERPREAPGAPAPLEWAGGGGQLVDVGHEGAGFAFDNEHPRHRVWLDPFELANRPVSCGEYLAFMEDDGYRRPELWLSDAWDSLVATGLEAPLYWRGREGGWWQTTLGGTLPVDPAEPVCHVSFWEADAYARWSGNRLPREEEWEVLASDLPIEGNLLGTGRFHPAPLSADEGPGIRRIFGDVWEWTASPYVAYPGFHAAEGAIGEYNGKFMNGRMVLRGGCCVTPEGHVRATYRNFFEPGDRWPFAGIRLARDA